MSKTHGGKIVDGSCLCNLQEDLLETQYSSSFLYGDPPGQSRKGSTVESCWRYQGDRRDCQGTFSGVLYLKLPPLCDTEFPGNHLPRHDLMRLIDVDSPIGRSPFGTIIRLEMLHGYAFQPSRFSPLFLTLSLRVIE